jgi:hypothetical protein
MSYDHEIVVRGRKRSVANIRRLAAEAVAAIPGARLLPPDEDDDEDEDDDGTMELGFAFGPGRGGCIAVERLLRGYRLSIDSQSGGNRESWEVVGDALELLAAALGKVVEGDDASRLSEETYEDEPVSRRKRRPLAEAALVTLLGPDGAALACAKAKLESFQVIGPKGHFPGVYGASFLDEAYRYEARATAIEVTLYDEKAAAYRRYRWSLDGYGRIAGYVMENLEDPFAPSRGRRAAG